MHQDNQNPLKPSHRLVQEFNLCGPHFRLNPHNSSGMRNPNWQDRDTSKSAPAKNAIGAHRSAGDLEAAQRIGSGAAIHRLAESYKVIPQRGFIPAEPAAVELTIACRVELGSSPPLNRRVDIEPPSKTVSSGPIIDVAEGRPHA